MNTKNVGSNDQKQISDIKTDNTAQISGKTIKLATTQTNTTQIDAKISDANLQGKGAKKGFWGIVRTIALNPVSAVSSALYVAAHIALHPVNALFHPAQTLKEGFNDSLLADKFNAAPTKTNDSIKEQADKLEKEKSFEDKLVLSDQEMPMSDAKDVYEQNKQKSAQVEQVTPVASEADFSEIAQENHSKDTQDTTPTKISEKDIKESWSKYTFDHRRLVWTSYNTDVKKMSTFWGKFCAWFQAIFTTRAETKKLLIGRIVDNNAAIVDHKQDIQQAIKASIDNEKENIADLSNLKKEMQLEDSIKNAIIFSRNQLKNAAKLLATMRTILKSPVANALPDKEKLKLVQQLISEGKKYALLKVKIANNLLSLRKQNPDLYEQVRLKLHKK